MSVRLLSRIPLRFSVPILIALPVLIVAVVLSLLAYGQHQTAARDMTRQNLLRTHGQIQTHLDSLLDAPGRLNRVNTELITQGALPANDIARWRETLIVELQAYDMLSVVLWGSVDGQTTWICRYIGDKEHTYYALKDAQAGKNITEYRVDAKGKVDPTPASVFPFDPHSRPWYTGPIKADGPIWSQPYLWVGGNNTKELTLGIAHGQPVRDAAGKLLGVIDAELSLNDISHYLSRLQIGKTGGVYVVGQEGNLIASSVSAALASEGRRLPAKASERVWIANSARHLQGQFGSFTDIQETHQDTITVDGQELFLLVSPYTHPSGIQWRIVTMIPEDDFLADVRSAFRRSLLWSALAAVAMLLLGLAASLFMVRPILTLIHHVRQIGQGDLDGELNLDQSPELVRLSTEINDMSAGLRDRLKMRQSLALAMDVQQNLLPTETPSVEGLDIAGHSTYCDETGGDYYDFLDITGLSPTTVSVAIGDVVGHGIAAAMVMAGARGILRSHCGRTGSLAELLQHMNSHLCHDAGNLHGRFMTMFLMTLNPTHHELRWASAGHDMPFIYEPGVGFHRIDGSGLPLGVIDEESYEEYRFDAIRSGQVILVATDGVWETFDQDEQEFGKGRVCDLIERNADRTADEISHALQKEIAEFRGDGSQLDDITLIVIKVL